MMLKIHSKLVTQYKHAWKQRSSIFDQVPQDCLSNKNMLGNTDNRFLTRSFGFVQGSENTVGSYQYGSLIHHYWLNPSAPNTSEEGVWTLKTSPYHLHSHKAYGAHGIKDHFPKANPSETLAKNECDFRQLQLTYPCAYVKTYWLDTTWADFCSYTNGTQMHMYAHMYVHTTFILYILFVSICVYQGVFICVCARISLCICVHVYVVSHLYGCMHCYVHLILSYEAWIAAEHNDGGEAQVSKMISNG